MLKADINGKTGVLNVYGEGDLNEILADISSIIAKAYFAMKKNDPEIAALFREGLIFGVTDPNSPIWNVGATIHGTFVCREQDAPIDVKEIEALLRSGATPEMVSAYCNGGPKGKINEEE